MIYVNTMTVVLGVILFLINNTTELNIYGTLYNAIERYNNILVLSKSFLTTNICSIQSHKL